MKKQKKILVLVIVFLTILLSSCQVFATNLTDYLGEIQFSEEFQKYMELSDEARQNTIMPRMYEIPKTSTQIINPFKIARKAGTTVYSNYSLKSIIPENMVVKDQQETGTCYAFSILGALESTLALKDYRNNIPASVYDFSERHMEYSSSRTFLNGVINEKAYAREVGDGGVVGMPTAYLTNGTGAIAESEMPFENNEDKIDISEIQNKTVITQVSDTVEFPAYSVTEDTTKIKQQMKEHIMNYGAIDAGIHGAQVLSDCYNHETGAIYCSDSSTYAMDHAVIIVGWDDNYSKENFVETNRPSNNGAWIIRNSWGTEKRLTLVEAKEILYDYSVSEGINTGWTSASDVPDDIAIELIETSGYTYNAETQEGVLKMGDDGFMYISYEDVYVYSSLTGIMNAQTEITYENLYQYDYYGSFMSAPFNNTSKIYLATVFDKKTTGTEYLTQVSVNASETYTCKVYVNPNGTSKSMSDLQQIDLKAGESETFDAGYHTIEFLKPLKINSDSFVVVLEIEGTQENAISAMMEFNFGEYFSESYYDNWAAHCYDNVTVESGKCFWTVDEVIETNEWIDCAQMYSLSNGNYPNFDTTIKAFTTAKVLENIEVTTPPTKTSYIEGQNFDSTGMVVKGRYGDGTSKEIADYTITGGTNLQAGQTSVTISYEDKTTTQSITVVENVVESIAITTPPTKTEYWAGERFDSTGMVVQATYTDGTTTSITDYTIKNGTTLQNDQTSVTIEYEGKTATQAITVKPNSVVEEKSITGISVKTMPTKLQYKQNKEQLDLTGGVVKISYNDNTSEEILMTSEQVEVSGFDNKKVGTQTIVVKYQGFTANFNVEIIQEAKPENSNFVDMKGNIKSILAYYYTDVNKKGYTLINVELRDIEKATKNDKMEYYYYLSSNQKETNIANWVKVNELKQSDNGLSFEINTLDISNYDEIANAEKVYLYIKEVATKNDLTAEEVASAVLLDIDINNIKIEMYIDGEKRVDVDSDDLVDATPGEEPDNTLAPGIIPNAGKSALILFVALVIFVIGRIAYARYKDIELK